jgi:glycosyltransferase involved in cell wall biosynthesis
MPTITIHTTTYNRYSVLGRVYESLCAQTCKDFEWIITDDGSTDGTELLVEGWLSDNNGFNLIYSRLPHVGFPRALNDGVSRANCSWFMMLDSDDWIIPTTIETLIPWIEDISGNSKMAGIGVTRCHLDGSYMKNQVPVIDSNKGFIDASNIERKKYNLDMDCFEVTRTELLRQYPFQCWPTEKYAPPQLNYNEMSLLGYQWRWRASMLYICEYLPNGLTKDNSKVWKNPMGYAMMHNQNLRLPSSFRDRFYNAMQMTALCLASGNCSYLRKSNNLFFTLLSLPVGLVLGIRRKRQIKKYLPMGC